MVVLAGEDAEALMLQVQEGARIKEDLSAERALCKVVQAGGVVYKVAAGSFAGHSRLHVKLSDLTRLEVGAWGRGVGRSGSTVEDACKVYKAVASRLGCAWREQKWRAWSNGPMKEQCRSMEFGFY
eukprot:942914-Pleurochrysis_carterae.AAC.1